MQQAPERIPRHALCRLRHAHKDGALCKVCLAQTQRVGLNPGTLDWKVGGGSERRALQHEPAKSVPNVTWSRLCPACLLAVARPQMHYTHYRCIVCSGRTCQQGAQNGMTLRHI